MTDPRPFKFAVQATAAGSAREWQETARCAEDLGYATLFLADHYLGPGPAGSGTLYPPQQLAPIAAMMSAAAWTSRLRIGCRVFCMDYHVPAVLAKEAATMDLLSDGRLEFGIGAGWHAAEYEAMGLSLGDAPDRVDKLEEVVALVKAHFSGQAMDIRGDHVTVSGYSGLPVPVQRPHPPILIGGSKRRVLSFAAREADIVSIANVPWQDELPDVTFKQRIDVVRDAAGDRVADLDLEWALSYCEVTDDADSVLRRIAPGLRNADPRNLRKHPNCFVGSVREMAERLVAQRETFGTNYVTVNQDRLEEFAPVVADLAGT